LLAVCGEPLFAVLNASFIHTTLLEGGTTMKTGLVSKVTLAGWLCLASWTLVAQQSPTAAGAVDTSSMVPRLINYSGGLKGVGGKGLSGMIGVIFLLYKDEQGGAPLWVETQNVTPDKNGRYTVTLGATASEGLPTDVFANGEARWLGVQVEGQAEQPRVLLVSVPYALKAVDAQTLGGLPASAFALAGTQSTQTSSGGTTNIFAASPTGLNTTSIGGTGTTDFLPPMDLQHEPGYLDRVSGSQQQRRERECSRILGPLTFSSQDPLLITDKDFKGIFRAWFAATTISSSPTDSRSKVIRPQMQAQELCGHLQSRMTIRCWRQ
jgi:hypothetical protein